MKMEELKETILAAAPDKRVSCAVALKMAKEANVSPKEIGRLLNELGVKIIQCRLGCF
ncbi:MAG: hypothetical protein V1736_05715 [Pseudomonadota bacterium]